ncbi:MAG TPA: ABC transporter substrate-binding protein [Dehalococcoidia bacterium]|nr:ABC transporter substrate-binding protein [Dehalococcoidia bacterium]
MGENELDLRYWTAQRISRRRLLGGAAIGGATVAAIGIVGCSKTSSPPAGTSTPPARGTTVVQDGSQDGPAKPGGILHVQQTVTLPSLNPFGPSILALAQGLFLGFTVYDHMWYVPTDTGTTELFLATKIEQPDPLTVIATLGDATFHDKPPVNGRAVKASDVVASFKHFRDQLPIGFDWLHDVMADITAPDDHTVKITQKQTWAWVFTSSNAGSPWSSSIIPEEIVHDDKRLANDAIGSGQWQLLSQDNGANIKLRKFQKFRQFAGTKSIAGQPFLNGIDFLSIADGAPGLAAFKAGQIDQYGFSTKSEADDTRAALGDKIVVASDLARDFFCLMLKYEPPFTDDRVRHAFNLLIDRDEIISLMVEGSGLKCPPVPPAQLKYQLPTDDPDLKEYFRHDIADAKKLLDAAGFDYNQVHELKHSVRPTDAQVSQILQQQLQRGGVKVKLAPEDLVKWFSQSLGQGNFHMTAFDQLPYEDPDLPLRFFMAGKGNMKNFMGYDNPQVNAAILAAAGELDETARIKKVQTAQKTIIQNWAPMLNLYSQINYGARYAYVKGTISGRGSYGLFNRTTWLDDAGRRAATS